MHFILPVRAVHYLETTPWQLWAVNTLWCWVTTSLKHKEAFNVVLAECFCLLAWFPWVDVDIISSVYKTPWPLGPQHIQASNGILDVAASHFLRAHRPMTQELSDMHTKYTIPKLAFQASIFRLSFSDCDGLPNLRSRLLQIDVQEPRKTGRTKRQTFDGLQVCL